MEILRDAVSMLFRMPLDAFASPVGLFDLFTKGSANIKQLLDATFLSLGARIGSSVGRLVKTLTERKGDLVEILQTHLGHVLGTVQDLRQCGAELLRAVPATVELLKGKLQELVSAAGVEALKRAMLGVLRDDLQSLPWGDGSTAYQEIVGVCCCDAGQRGGGGFLVRPST